MNERQLRRRIAEVRSGARSRRVFLREMAALGLSAPFVAQMLAHSGVAMAAGETLYPPTKAGGGGLLKLLWWQGPTLLNPHFATGVKDQDGSRLFYEPLAGWDPDGNLAPVLAAEVPSVEAGTVDRDLMWVVWKLKQGVKWHDGAPFTADDCVFNWQYATDPATAATTIGTYKDIKVSKLDDFTIRVDFPKPMPFWADAFVSVRGLIVPKHIFQNYRGANSREAPANLAPVGTGPYLFVDFRPGDLIRGKINPNYHLPNRPHFDAIEMKGGGDAVSAARAVLQTGEYDFAWNMQVEDELLKRLEEAGRGHVVITPTGAVEHIELNNTDPWKEVDGERSSVKAPHPILTDQAVRQGLNLLVDRLSVERFIYGRTGKATANYINNPAAFVSKNTAFEFNIEKAIPLLDKAGWKPGADGVRAKDGVRLRLVYQTSINAPRQKTQQIVKQACEKAGIEIEIKTVPAQVFFSSDIGNPDTASKFYCDMQMLTTTMSQPDPREFMRRFLSTEAAAKHNKWQGRNVTRWANAEFDAAYDESEHETDPVKRAALYIKMNDLVVQNIVTIPVVARPAVAAVSNRLHVRLSGWDSYLGDFHNWYADA
ncbi:MAG TPA: peptide ABC transporter substrate-binding protein [Stellaceae bacterium]|jgi:peptide/nickel transport system substrate-binding protein|nr:peptide ABC transporter substrate-binding protein [Stellaceae bacterium]